MHKKIKPTHKDFTENAFFDAIRSSLCRSALILEVISIDFYYSTISDLCNTRSFFFLNYFTFA